MKYEGGIDDKRFRLFWWGIRRFLKKKKKDAKNEPEIRRISLMCFFDVNFFLKIRRIKKKRKYDVFYSKKIRRNLQ